MKKKLTVLLSLLHVFILTTNSYSQSLTISGGDSYGMIICAKGYVYAWGSNPNNVLGLKTPPAGVNVNAPHEVNLPVGLTMQQVIAGSGAFSTALSCSNVVYAWGTNVNGECGQGTTSAATAPVTQAKAVLKGVAPGYNEDGTPGGNFLGGVKYIAAATASAYAILNDGRCVSWGSNSNGQLAANRPNGGAGMSTTPVFVINGSTNQPLQNVIHVAGGDYTAYFLVDDGNGWGTVYSCGERMGRPGASNVAMPVRKADGTTLSGISMMAAGDVHGLAVEGATGNVYGWGNDGWGCLVGCNTGGQRCPSETAAYQVVSGDYQKISGEKFLTDVKVVIGGRGYSAAVTKEGYILYWGNNESNGGYAPNGSTATDFCATGPQFAVYCNASGQPPAINTSTAATINQTVIRNAVNIARGDNFGFMVNDENKFYAWGLNDKGQLGLGISQSRHCLEEIKNIPCDLPDPMPEVFLVPKMEKCFGNPFDLFCNFTPPKGKEAVYKFDWYYSQTATGTFAQLTPVATYNKNTISVEKEGFYKVKVSYTGTNAPCNVVDVVEATTQLVDKTMPVDTLIITSCVEKPLAPAASDNICFEFISKYATASKALPSSFAVFSKQTGGTALKTVDLGVGAANAKGAFCVTGAQIDKVERVGNDTLYSIWIEDRTKETGALAPPGQYNASGTADGVWNAANATKILVIGDIELNSLKVAFSNRDNNNTANFTVSAGIYQSNGNSVGARVGTLATQVVSVAPSAATVATLNFGGRLITGHPMRGTEYFIVINIQGGNYNVNQYTFPMNADNITGGIIMRMDGGTTQGDNPGNVNNPGKNTNIFYDLQFNRLSAYDCGRIKLTSKYYCPPCKKPIEFEVKLPAGEDKTLCPGESITFTSSDQANATDFEFVWYKMGTTIPSTGTGGITAPPKTISYSDLDGAVGSITTFALLVRDKAKPTQTACHVTHAIGLMKAEMPEYRLRAGDPVCEYEAVEGAFVEFTKGVPPFKYTFTIDGGAPISGSAPVKFTEYLLDKKAGYYRLTGTVSDTYCSQVVPEDLVVQVIINPRPAPPSTTKLTFLKKAGASESIADAATADPGHVLYWFTSPPSGNGTENGTTTAPMQDISTEGVFTYWVRQKNLATGCVSPLAEVTIEVNNCPIPAPFTTKPTILICNYDATPALEVVFGKGWDGNEFATRPSGLHSTFNFYDASNTLLHSSATGSYTPTIDKSVEKQYVFYVSEYIGNLSGEWSPCEGPRTQIIIEVKKPAVLTITPANQEVCAGTQNPLFTASGKASGATVEWYTSVPVINGSNDGSLAVAKSDTHRPTETAVGTQTMYALQRTTDGCLSDYTSQTWKINTIPAAPAVTDNNVCFSNDASKNTTVSATGTAIKWYKNATVTTGETVLGSGATYKSTETAVGVYKYYATQTVDGCESTDRGEATYTIVKLPDAPVVTVSNPEICAYDSEPTFTITNQESGATVNWYKADKTTLLYSGTGNTYTPQRANGTEYYATQTTACTSEFSQKISFVINPKPETPKVTSQKICAGEDIPFLRTDKAIDNWYRFNDATGFIQSGATYRPTLTDIGTRDSITFYIQRTEKNCKSDIAPVYLKIIAAPTVKIDGGNKAICYAETIDVTASHFNPAFSAGSNLKWTVINEDNVRKPVAESGVHKITLNSAHLPKAGKYTIDVVYGYNYDGKVCESVPAQVMYTVHPQPNTPVVQNQIRCQSEAMQSLVALGSQLITWESVDGKLPDWTGSNYNFQQMNLTNVALGTYEFRLYDTDAITKCKSEQVTMTFEVAPRAVTKIVGDTRLCAGVIESVYTLEQVPPSRPSSYNWQVSGGRHLYARDENTQSVRYVDWDYAGMDTIWVTERTYAGCEGRDSIVVRVAAFPEPMFTAKNAGIGKETSLQFSNETKQQPFVYNTFGIPRTEEVPYTMYWNFGRIDMPYFIQNYVDTIVEYAQRNQPVIVHDFKYGWARPLLTVENSFGCKASYSTEIFVDITTGFFIPSAFAPGNPAASVRIFKPVAFNLEYCKVWIYDAWGNLLWYGDKVEDGIFVDEWNGTYDGELLPTGTYIWHIDAKFLNGKKWKGTRHNTSGNPKVRGSVVLLR